MKFSKENKASMDDSVVVVGGGIVVVVDVETEVAKVVMIDINVVVS